MIRVMYQITILGRLSVVVMGILLSACASVQYAAYEKVGIHKRDLLVDRVEDARDAQDVAKDQTVNAYERLKQLINSPNTDLDANYKKLAAELEAAESARDNIDARLDDVESVAQALFAEWRAELEQYSSEQLKTSSAQKLQLTTERYTRLKASMDAARERIDPVMHVLQDQVLFLKHNLNAQVLNSLQGELGAVETQVDRLIRDMEAAIAEANRFVGEMRSGA